MLSKTHELLQRTKCIDNAHDLEVKGIPWPPTDLLLHAGLDYNVLIVIKTRPFVSCSTSNSPSKNAVCKVVGINLKLKVLDGTYKTECTKTTIQIFITMVQSNLPNGCM